MTFVHKQLLRPSGVVELLLRHRVFQVLVYLDDLISDSVEVELFADELDGRPPELSRAIPTS